MPPKLPPSLWPSYSTYKSEEKELTRWLLSRAEVLDITSLDDNSTAPPAATSSKPSGKKKGAKGRKVPEKAPQSLPTDLKAGEMAKLMAKMWVASPFVYSQPS